MDSDQRRDSDDDDLIVGVGYLKEWGLSESTIKNFEENHISLKLLDCIQEAELKELIPNLKERILFKHGLDKLQNIIHTTASDETLSFESDFSAPSPAASTSSNELPTTKEKSHIELDFATKFKGSEMQLFKKWPEFLEKSHHLKTVKAASDYMKYTEENPSESVILYF